MYHLWWCFHDLLISWIGLEGHIGHWCVAQFWCPYHLLLWSSYYSSWCICQWFSNLEMDTFQYFVQSFSSAFKSPICNYLPLLFFSLVGQVLQQELLAWMVTDCIHTILCWWDYPQWLYLLCNNTNRLYLDQSLWIHIWTGSRMILLCLFGFLQFACISFSQLHRFR